MSISIVFARGLVAELQNRRLDADALLARSGIERERLADIREHLQPDETERLVTSALEMTRDPALALAVGASEGTLQLYGHLVRAQKTLREAFAANVRYSALVSRGPRWELVERGDLAFFCVTPRLRPSPLRRFLMEYAITTTMSLCRSFFPRREAGQRTLLEAVHFQHPRPEHVAAYPRYFPCPVHFEQPTNAIVYPRALLDRPHVHGDATLDRVLREAAERLLSDQPEPAVHERVRLLLRYSVDLKEVSAGRVACSLGLSLRTLRRRLASEGHSLSSLVDEARCRVACEALRRDDVNLPALSADLGFSETSAFFRAFKRWTGRTPGAYRRLSPGASPLEADAPGPLGA